MDFITIALEGEIIRQIKFSEIETNPQLIKSMANSQTAEIM